MALVHHSVESSPKEQNRCAFMFCMTWVGFFVFIGIVTWIGSSL
jgi:hypothetical protein